MCMDDYEFWNQKKVNNARERNEALDCAIYATAGLELLNPNFDFLQEFYARGGIANAPARAKRPPSKGISL